MKDFRVLMAENLMNVLEVYIPGYSDIGFNLIVLTWIAVCAIILHLIMHRIVLKVLASFRMIDRKNSWLNAFSRFGLFNNIVLMIQGAIVQVQARAWLDEQAFVYKLLNTVSDLFILFFGLMAFFSLLNSLQSKMYNRTKKLQIPVRGMVQTAKLVFSLIFGLLVLAILLGKSPLLLLSGLGALSAVLMLVFKDPILGLVAGIQLSANNMLMVGDWLEMPKYNANGDVIDIGLTTVKVQNWDKTITTIPTYALISDSFKNWRGMSEAGGRRIKRSVLINTASIKFLDAEDIERLMKVRLLSLYLEEKQGSIEKDNSALGDSYPVNRRRLTNIGTFRVYMLAYLKSHPRIQQDMTLMVRQLESSNNGVPLEIYVFTNTTAWTEYESIQSDIFDHIFAIVSEFELIVHESPTGNDMRMISK